MHERIFLLNKTEVGIPLDSGIQSLGKYSILVIDTYRE